ncbi:hypothetical protein OG568_61190 (plasmid) [Streptomyces sp. NBC_01450]|uniref:hypothetical protein n=1 Tax=Streptomyces sp. NBC_01450 TaxID=2903871 RepID=UPI002E2F54F9|nr:hypothetical protein [Streptomyces sp. NBC_01450]
MPADGGGEVDGAGLMGGEAGDRVDVLAGFGPAGGLAAAVDPDGEVGVGKAMPPRLSAIAQVLIERDSRRPWAVAEAVCWTLIEVQGRAASWA